MTMQRVSHAVDYSVEPWLVLVSSHIKRASSSFTIPCGTDFPTEWWDWTHDSKRTQEAGGSGQADSPM